MSAGQGTSRCWLCDHAIWFLPIWTWVVVCFTGLLMLGLLRPDAMTGWLSLMGVVMIIVGAGIAVLMDENNRDRDRAARKVDGPSPAAPVVRPVRNSR